MTVTNRLIAQSDAMGALPLLFAATEDLESGRQIGGVQIENPFT